VVLGKFPLAAEDFRNNARRSEDFHEIFLFEVVLIQKESQYSGRFRRRERVLFFFEIFDQKSQELGELLFSRAQILAAPVQFTQNFCMNLVFLLGVNDFGRSSPVECCVL
jgi:hypothetical protein